MSDNASAAPTTDAALAQAPVRSDWRGAWVWAEPVAAKDRNAYVFFRREFGAAGPTVLEIAITADSFYTLWLDGQFLGRGPARSHLEYYSFDEFRVEVAPGTHCLAVLAHHIGEINATVMTGRPGLLVDVITHLGCSQAVGICACDDPGIELSTGPGWKCLRAAAWRQDLSTTMSHFGFWEECDLRLLPPDWTKPGFDDRAWAAPVVIGTPPCAPWLRLIPRDIPLPEYTELAPVGVAGGGSWRAGAEDPILSKTVAARSRDAATQPPALAAVRYDLDSSAAGHYVTVDFGRTVSGYPVLEFADSAVGQCVEVSYDDLLGPAQAVNPERSYAHMSDRFRLPGGACRMQTVQPRGFRFVTIDFSGPGRLVLARVAAIEEVYPFVLGPVFRSPDAELARYVEKAALTVRICTTDAFTDCATRERVQWMEDMYMHCRVAAYAFGDTRLQRRALFQGAQCALPDGRINGFMPSERTNCAFAASSLVWLHLLVDYWLFAGNADVGCLLPTARRLLELLRKLEDADGLVASWPAGQFWDWAPIEGEGCLLLTNAAYAWALERMAQHEVFGPVLGNDLAARAQRLRTAAHARFWDPVRQLYRDAVPKPDLTPIYSQQANVMAVLGGVCPAAERAPLLRRIIDPQNLGPVPIGEHSLRPDRRLPPEQIVPVGTLWFGHFICQALFENGMDAEAFAQMRFLWGACDNLPTFPETRIQHGNIFLCHGWAAGPAFLLPAYVLGVQPMGPGWQTIRVTPHPGTLREASGTILTPRGPLTVEWTVRGGKCEVKVQAPHGVAVQVVV